MYDSNYQPSIGQLVFVFSCSFCLQLSSHRAQLYGFQYIDVSLFFLCPNVFMYDTMSSFRLVQPLVINDKVSYSRNLRNTSEASFS